MLTVATNMFKGNNKDTTTSYVVIKLSFWLTLKKLSTTYSTFM